MRDCDKLGSLRQTLFEFLDMEDAFIVHRREDQLCALSFTNEMPWHNIGVMLHDRQKDFIAFADIRHAITIGDRVDRFGRVLRKDNFVHRTGVQKAPYRLTRLFIGIRCRI